MYNNAYPHMMNNHMGQYYQTKGSQDDRLGFLAPFLLGGLAGGLVAAPFYRPYYRPYYYPPTPYPYPPYYY